MLLQTLQKKGFNKEKERTKQKSTVPKTKKNQNV